MYRLSEYLNELQLQQSLITDCATKSAKTVFPSTDFVISLMRNFFRPLNCFTNKKLHANFGFNAVGNHSPYSMNSFVCSKMPRWINRVLLSHLTKDDSYPTSLAKHSGKGCEIRLQQSSQSRNSSSCLHIAAPNVNSCR